MRSLAALALLLSAVIALLSKQLLAFLILAPLAWLAMTWAHDSRDDIGVLMGLCLMTGVIITLIEIGTALLH